jgi:hypothetical protein
MKNIAYTITWIGSVTNMYHLGVESNHAIPSTGLPASM